MNLAKFGQNFYDGTRQRNIHVTMGQSHLIGTSTSTFSTFLEVDETPRRVVAVHGHCASVATAFAVWTLHLHGIKPQSTRKSRELHQHSEKIEDSRVPFG